MKRVKVENSQLETTESGVSFTTRLDYSSRRCIIHLVANGRVGIIPGSSTVVDRVNFDDLRVNMDENTAMPLLHTSTHFTANGAIYNTPPCSLCLCGDVLFWMRGFSLRQQ